MRKYKFLLLVILIAAASISLYGLFSYIVVIKVQNDVFLSSINQSISQINLRLKDLESTLKPGIRRHYKKVCREEEKNILAESSSHRPSGNYGLVIKNGNSTLSSRAP